MWREGLFGRDPRRQSPRDMKKPVCKRRFLEHYVRENWCRTPLVDNLGMNLLPGK